MLKGSFYHSIKIFKSNSNFPNCTDPELDIIWVVPFYYVFIKIIYLDLFASENVSVAQGINIDDSTE